MQMKRRSKHSDNDLVALIEEYRATHGNLPHSMDFVAVWALNEGKIQASRRSIVKEVARRLSRAAQHQHHRDPQGRRVRTYHAAKYQRLTTGGQMVFETMWDHIESMSAEHWRVSSSQRLGQIAGECKSLKTDEESFMENNPNGSGYVSNLVFNFEGFVESGAAGLTETLAPSEFSEGFGYGESI